LAPLALGSDTSGSVRGPAAHCGVVGLKPTYGLVSRKGVFPLSYALDHCGPLTRHVRDSATALQVIAGYDPHDVSSVQVPPCDYAAMLGRDLRGLRLGFPRHFLTHASAVSPEVVAALERALVTLTHLGADVAEVQLPEFALFHACGRVIMTAESFAIHELDLARRPRDFGRYTYQRTAPGATLSAADLLQAFRLRGELTASVNRVLTDFDALITPNALFPAAPFTDFGDDWPPTKAASATQTIPFNVTGNPALAMPIGFSAARLPLSMQIVGRPFDEAMVFRVAAAYEAATGLTREWPPEPDTRTQETAAVC
jgi:aspartyl-tRNA(Asn)/glutamyl-tRNA(Gln) amidotransferase subunit A